MKFYTDFVTLTTKQYEHCTLEEKLSVYVQHKPACVVPFLLELIWRVNELEKGVKIHSTDKRHYKGDRIDD